MIAQIFLHRIQEDLLSLKTPVVIAVAVVLMVAATLVTVGDLERRQEAYGAAVSRETDLAELMRPPVLLGALVGGVDSDVYGGKSVAGIQVAEVPGPAYENPLRALFPIPDLRFVVQYVLSLLALMMGFDVVAGAKERRTLALLFSNPLSRPRYLLGQSLGSFAGLAAAFLLAFLLAVLVLATSGVGEMGGDEALRLAALAAVSLLYLAVFFLLGVAASTGSHTSARAFLAALLSWAVLVLVLPHALMLTSGHWRSIPSVEVVAAEKNAVRNDILAPEGAFATEWPRANAAMETVDRRYARQVAAQEAAMETAVRLSPAGSFVLAASSLAGTSPADAESHAASVLDYLSRVRRWVYVDRPANPEAAEPLFFARRRGAAEALAGAAPDAALLALWAASLSLFALWRFHRYDLR